MNPWKAAGVVEDTTQHDAAMEAMMAAVRACGSKAVAEVVFREALFQVFVLPERDPAFQQAHQWRKP